MRIENERIGRLGLLHQVPLALREILREAGFGWAAWNTSWRHAESGAAITFAEVSDHPDEDWLRARIMEVLDASSRD